MNALTVQQKRVFDFIRQWLAQYPYAPTVREIMRGLGYTTPSIVQFHLRALERKGFIGRAATVARGLWLIDEERAEPLREPIAEGR
jgi:repressor LexA